jgi:uncharacterized protein (DUF3084 family)
VTRLQPATLQQLSHALHQVANDLSNGAYLGSQGDALLSNVATQLARMESQLTSQGAQLQRLEDQLELLMGRLLGDPPL